MTKIISRKEAKSLNMKRYFTGKPCKIFGHISERATRNGECLSCAKDRLELWRKENPEKKAKHRKKHFLLNSNREYENRKKWMLNHPEKEEEFRIKKNEATSIWSSKNKPKRNAGIANRRAAKLRQSPKWLTAGDYFEMECIYKYCGSLRSIGFDYHVDHILPLQGKTVSGFHVPLNLQVIPALQNISKGNRYADLS